MGYIRVYQLFLNVRNNYLTFPYLPFFLAHDVALGSQLKYDAVIFLSAKTTIFQNKKKNQVREK